jgi:DNA topoisomerase-1
MRGLYELSEDKQRRIDGVRVVANLKKFIKDNPGIQVYLGTDDDREGESIAAFVVKYVGLKNPPRIRFNAITKDKIEEAIANAGILNIAAVSSREARRLIDRIFGYTVSPILQSITKLKGVSAGRVQTAVEALVIERERRIRSFKKQIYYTVHMDMGGWEAQWQIPAEKRGKNGPKPNSEYDVDDTAARCFDAAVARLVANQKALRVDACDSTHELRLPPPPLHTFAMIQSASKALGWAADKTMQVAQKLFEGDGSGHGHITYHRTDSPNIDAEAAEEIRMWLYDQGLPIPDEANTWRNKNKQAQEGHEAIRPTHFMVEEAGANDEQRALYRIIRDRAVYSQLAPAVYAVKKIALTDAINGNHRFTATARALLEPGWLETRVAQTLQQDQDDDESDEKAGAVVKLPDLSKGSLLGVQRFEVKEHATSVSPRYTTRSLTGKLEKLGIGRPATIGTVFSNFKLKGTILERKDGRLEATPQAERCYDILYPRFSFANIGYTAELERALDMIASQDLDGMELCQKVWDQLDLDCAALLSGTTAPT